MTMYLYYIFTALKILCSSYASLPQPHTFLLSSFACPECHVLGIIQKVASDWLSCGNSHLWLLHAFLWLFQCRIVIHFLDVAVYSSTEEYLGCFQVLTVMNEAAINNCVGFCVDGYVFNDFFFYKEHVLLFLQPQKKEISIFNCMKIDEESIEKNFN